MSTNVSVGDIVIVKRQRTGRPRQPNPNWVAHKMVPLVVTDVGDGGVISGVALAANPNALGTRNHAHPCHNIAPGDGFNQWQHTTVGTMVDQAKRKEAELNEAIKDAIKSLDPDDSKAWTIHGKPHVTAIEAILGRNITAEQRDAAWTEIQGTSA